MPPGIGGFFVFPQRRFRGRQAHPDLSFQRRKVTLRVCNQRGQCPNGAPTPFELAPSSPQRYRFTAHHTGHAHSEPPIGMCSWCFLSGLRLRLAGGGGGSAAPASPAANCMRGGGPYRRRKVTHPLFSSVSICATTFARTPSPFDFPAPEVHANLTCKSPVRCIFRKQIFTA